MSKCYSNDYLLAKSNLFSLSLSSYPSSLLELPNPLPGGPPSTITISVWTWFSIPSLSKHIPASEQALRTCCGGKLEKLTVSICYWQIIFFLCIVSRDRFFFKEDYGRLISRKTAFQIPQVAHRILIFRKGICRYIWQQFSYVNNCSAK